MSSKKPVFSDNYEVVLVFSWSHDDTDPGVDRAIRDFRKLISERYAPIFRRPLPEPILAAGDQAVRAIMAHQPGDKTALPVPFKSSLGIVYAPGHKMDFLLRLSEQPEYLYGHPKSSGQNNIRDIAEVVSRASACLNTEYALSTVQSEDVLATLVESAKSAFLKESENLLKMDYANRRTKIVVRLSNERLALQAVSVIHRTPVEKAILLVKERFSYNPGGYALPAVVGDLFVCRAQAGWSRGSSGHELLSACPEKTLSRIVREIRGPESPLDGMIDFEP